MKSRFNKFITLMLLIGTFAFLMEAEEKITAAAKEELSKWASLLPAHPSASKMNTLNPYTQAISIEEGLWSKLQGAKNAMIN